MKNFNFLLFALVISFSLNAQTISRAGAQDSAYILMNGTIHIGNGEVINNGVVVFDKGKIAAVGDAQSVHPNTQGARVIDCTGKQIYPGLIAANTILGLSEIDAVRATLDYYEVGDYNPSVRSMIAYNTDSKVIPTIRSNGVLLAQIAPEGGVISGSSSIMQLDAWNWEDATYQMDDGIHLNWPSYLTFKFQDGHGVLAPNEDYEKQVDAVKEFFREAKAYNEESSHSEMNIKFNAMKGVFDGSKRLYIHADYVKEIMNAVDFVKENNIANPVIVGGQESYKCTDLLKQNNIPVILGRIQSLPSTDDDNVDSWYKAPYLLQQAGVQFCLSFDGAWQQRNLPFDAGEAVAYGLTKEQALTAITSSAAKIMGIDNRTGTIETGKDANIIVSTGDILDMQTSNVIYAFIQGRNVNLDNIQKQLFHTYMKKYGLEK
jgi:imidazolonepropionase-like amidohydrolase